MPRGIGCIRASRPYALPAMDSLTQAVLGAAVGEACLGHKLGNKALWWGATSSRSVGVLELQLVHN